jgi:hypothetical protein
LNQRGNGAFTPRQPDMLEGGDSLNDKEIQADLPTIENEPMILHLRKFNYQ